MLTQIRAALVVLATAFCAQAMAQGSSANLVQDAARLAREADSKSLLAKPFSRLSEANCSAGNAVLGALAEQNFEAVQRALNSAKERYNDSYKLIIQAADTGAFKAPIDKKTLANWIKYTDADLSNIQTREDMLRRIATIVKNSTEAIARIESGKSEKGDLALVIKNSAEITRLIAAFYDLMIA